MNILVRKALQEDRQAIFPLWQAQIQFHYELDSGFYPPLALDEEKQFEAYFTHALKNDDPYFYIAEMDGKIVGFTTFKKGHAQYDDNAITEYGWVLELFVEESYRKHGVGKQLIDEAAKVFQAQGITHLKLDVSTHNNNALKFYEDNGFENHVAILYKKI
ncbi:MAG TPA: GNAT family N-acetyltransferase [Patescibacteria group bacterium]|nr:GNAT family N-acetyltransferase [Patescibacteria group bacterium]